MLMYRFPRPYDGFGGFVGNDVLNTRRDVLYIFMELIVREEIYYDDFFYYYNVE